MDLKLLQALSTETGGAVIETSIDILRVMFRYGRSMSVSSTTTARGKIVLQRRTYCAYGPCIQFGIHQARPRRREVTMNVVLPEIGVQIELTPIAGCPFRAINYYAIGEQWFLPKVVAHSNRNIENKIQGPAAQFLLNSRDA